MGDAANAVSPKYGRTCVAMLSVTATQLNIIALLRFAGWVGLILSSPDAARQAVRSFTLSTWLFHVKLVLESWNTLALLAGPPLRPAVPSQGVFFAGVLFTMGLFTSWEVPGCLQPMDTLQHRDLPRVSRLLTFPLLHSTNRVTGKMWKTRHFYSSSWQCRFP